MGDLGVTGIAVIADLISAWDHIQVFSIHLCVNLIGLSNQLRIVTGAGIQSFTINTNFSAIHIKAGKSAIRHLCLTGG